MPPPLKPPYRYLIVDDYAGVGGTNDELIARQAFFAGLVVLDCHTAESFEEPDESTTGDIRFVAIPAALDVSPQEESDDIEGLDDEDLEGLDE